MTRSRLALVFLLTLTGCSSMSWSARKDYKYDKPALAVITFENRSNAPLNWKLGEAVAELLSDSLYRTGQFRVLEREHLDAVIEEQELQSAGITGTNARYPSTGSRMPATWSRAPSPSSPTSTSRVSTSGSAPCASAAEECTQW